MLFNRYSRPYVLLFDIWMRLRSIIIDYILLDTQSVGIKIKATAGESVVAGDVCYLKNDGKFWKADADAEATTKGMLLMAAATISADADGLFLRKGFLKETSWSYTTADELYVHTTGGAPTATKPSGSGDCVRIVGYAFETDVAWFDPDSTYVEI